MRRRRRKGVPRIPPELWLTLPQLDRRTRELVAAGPLICADCGREVIHPRVTWREVLTDYGVDLVPLHPRECPDPPVVEPKP